MDKPANAPHLPQRDDRARSDVLFRPVKIGDLELRNRIVMAPMTRLMSPGGVPGEDVARYYSRRAEGGVGLIISEGSFVPHWSAVHEENAPRLYGAAALAGWKRVIDAVHVAGGRMFPQIWHVGQVRKAKVEGSGGIFDDIDPDSARRIGPSGMVGGNGIPVERLGKPATLKEIEEVIESYGIAAESMQALGFDGIEIHAAHGYLIDQFLWEKTNLRDDAYGGDIAGRTRFAVEIIGEIRRRVGAHFPVVMRLSTWKNQDFTAKLAHTPKEWDSIVTPMVNAGVDGFHVSQRRFWEGEFGTDMNLAGWTKKITGKTTISVGSVSLNNSMTEMLQGNGSIPEDNLAKLYDALERGDFDLIAIGRAMIANPDWPQRIRDGIELQPYLLSMLKTLA